MPPIKQQTPERLHHLWEMDQTDQQPAPAVWNVLGKKLPENEVVFFSQVILVYIVIITCIINLSLNLGDSNLWTCLLSSCLGYLLPNPKIDNSESTKTTPEDESTVRHPA